MSGNDSADRSAAEYGVRFHLAIAECLEGKNPSLEGVFGEHVSAAYGKLSKWLADNRYSALDGARYVEVSLAFKPGDPYYWSKARLCSPPSKEAHLYEDLRPSELAGTADLIVVPHDTGRPILVLDHKTGLWGDFSHPERLAQLQALGAAACVYWGREQFVPAVLHSPKDQVPIVYEGEALPWEPFAAPFAKQLARTGDGYMRPGAWCNRCPVRNQCPTQHADLLGKAGELVEKANLVGSELVVLNQSGGPLSREEKVGRLHLLMARFRDLDDAAVRAMKQAMVDDPELEPIRPDGKTLSLKTRKVERISKSSIIRALGEVKGAEMVEELRRIGALEEREETVLWAK